MSRPFIISLLLLLLSFPAYSQKITDFNAAMEYCSRQPLQNVEGIWEYPDDETKVLIRRAEFNPYEYEMIVLSTPDCRLFPGDVIGTLRQQADPLKFKLKIFRQKKRNLLVNPAHCVASLDVSKGALFVEAQKLKFSIGSLWFLPRFWRSIRVGFSNPESKLREGLVRIYPVTIGREKRYL